MPGGPVYWPLFLWGFAIAFVGSSGVWFGVWRFRIGRGRTIGLIASLVGGLVALFGLWVMFAALNLSGNLGG